MQDIQAALKSAAKDLFDTEIEPDLSRPEDKFGDYASNVALQLGKKIGKNPREVAIAIASKLHGEKSFEKVEVAGPGFINITLSNEALAKAVKQVNDLHKPLKGQEILVEFGDPNPFKQMHIGHLYSYIVGDSISRLLETSGASVRRLSYHGDVGLHVAKAIWGIQNNHEKTDLGAAYAAGAQAYDSDEKAKKEIGEINEHIYKKDSPEIKQLYESGRAKSFEYFDQILQELEIKTDKRYLESETTDIGVELVRQNIGKVFKQSQGAIIYEGEKAGLHTRVFITSKELPTYETKDLGLAKLKDKDFPQATRSIVITANEQSEYFKVMLAALAEIEPELAKKTTHLAHGFVSLSSGKMSSRTGEVYGAIDLLEDVSKASKTKYPNSGAGLQMAAVKYGLLNHRIGTDIVYDVQESISLEGNSGPYIQYAYARANSILQKAGKESGLISNYDPSERSLARKISEWPEVVAKATSELMPHNITRYLYELAQNFNSFYEKSRIIGDEREATRLSLVEAYSKVLKTGLSILNIEAPDKV